jgi:hypothetical protein
MDRRWIDTGQSLLNGIDDGASGSRRPTTFITKDRRAGADSGDHTNDG